MPAIKWVIYAALSFIQAWLYCKKNNNKNNNNKNTTDFILSKVKFEKSDL